ncbi:MAG: hypothetical protein V3U11_07000 [Planctomycetota bacterium]
MRDHRRLVWLLPLVLLGLLLPSCFTSMLWGTDLDDTSLTDDAFYSKHDDNPLWAKIIFTPFAIILDAITWPVQEFFSDEDDDCDSLDAVCR